MANIRIATDIYTNTQSSVDTNFEAFGAVAERVLSPPSTLKWVGQQLQANYLQGDWGSEKPVNFACLFGVEWIRNGTGTIRLRLSTVDDFATTVYDQTIDNSDIYGEVGLFPLLAHFWLSSQVTARYWRLDFTSSQTPDDIPSLGRIVIGRYWQPEINMDTGYQIGFSDRSDMQYTTANILRVLTKAKARTMAFQLSHLNQSDAVHWMKLVTQKEIFVSAYPEISATGTSDQQEQEQQHTIVGVIQQNVQVAAAHGTRRISNIQVIEDGVTGSVPGDNMSAVWLRVDRNLADVQHVKTARDNLLIGDDFARENFIDNSDMRCWQRATSVTGETGNGVKAADRWYMQFTQAGSETYSVERGPFYQFDDIGFGLARTLRVNTTDDHGGFNIQHRMGEHYLNEMSGQWLTLSFWARSQTPITFDRISILVRLFNSTIGDFEEPFTPSFFTTTAAMQKYVGRIKLPDIATERGNNPTIRLNIGTSDQQTTQWNDLDLTLVKLEIGDQPSRFETVDATTEFARCQRHYIRGDNSNILRPSLFSGSVTASGQYYANVQFPNDMEISPTVLLTNAGNQNFPATPGAPVVGLGGFTEKRTSTGTGTGFFSSDWTAATGY